MKRFFGCMIICLYTSLLICGCGSKEAESVYDLASSVKSESSSVAAQNAFYTLKWDDNRKCVLLTDKSTGDIWSSIPYDFLTSGKKSNQHLDSPLYIECFDPVDYRLTQVRGYNYAIRSGRVASAFVENGIEVTYYFDDYEISIPVRYVLGERSLDVTIDPSAIEEHTYHLVSVSMLPYMCAVENDSEDSYLFLPVGSGALMGCEQSVEGFRTFSGEVYGTDAARLRVDTWKNDERITMPVYGVKSKDSALLAVITSDAAAVRLEATAGDSKKKYSSVYPTFELRGYDITDEKTADVVRYSEKLSTNEKLSVSFYPLHGDDANYLGMSKVYRDYLISRYGMKKTVLSESSLLTIYGGAETKNHFFGVPYYSVTAATTFDEAKEIVRDFIEQTGGVPAVQLLGFTQSGLSIGKIAGGFNFGKQFGDSKSRKLLESYAKSAGATLFTDFDIIRYSKSGNGYTNTYDSAKTAILQRMKVSYYTKDIGKLDTSLPSYFLIRRNKLQNVAKKLLDALDSKNVSNVSLASIGAIAYSDYNNPDYYTKGHIADDVSSILTMMRQSDKKTIVSEANDYAAASADAMTAVDFTNGNFNVFYDKVPFLQLVFSGYKSMYSSPVNSMQDPEKAVLDAVSTGVGLSFSVIQNYDLRFAATAAQNLNTSLYSGNRSFIVKTMKRVFGFYQAINGASLISYNTLENGLIETVFDNGVTVLSNYTDNEITVNGITVAPNDFEFEGGDWQ